MLELMESNCGGGPGMGGTKGGRIPSRMSGSSTPPARSSPSHSREGSPLLLKRNAPGHTPLAGQLSAPPVQQYHERLHASLKRSNSLKRLLKLPIFGGQTGKASQGMKELGQGALMRTVPNERGQREGSE
ncbi:uncharacterized protein LOC122267560 [Penaeus japonicus]|uniref:uncharacterized protein LOC122267560 n=1 Tax=Penaeus japonicus TaxID=27405 RepID=UPI001C716194|nr:uncharacterized protein LOC122267560 [Penaeus japonicus]XP_042893544.1 uncharacterized protein LOC122267560 [Penaeus japonicus]XP_042893545.1 uncharacterized protein LOC122267560 [Penaeus japonicus]XP_042893546.1 uncharacterized protein LOC122267560 [Penaeus japonicus]